MFVKINIEQKAGLNNLVCAGYCKEQSVEVVYALNRYGLGRVCVRKVPVSCIGILNHQGSDVSSSNKKFFFLAENA